MKRLAILLGVFALPMAANADLIVVDLEDVAANTFLDNNSVTSQGFELAHSGSFAIVQGNSGQGATDFSGNGTNRLVSFNTSSITLSELGGSTFDIFSFEGGESWVLQPHRWATQIQAVGTFVGGGITTQIFDLDLFKDPLSGMQLFTFNDTFRDLLSVQFTGIGGNPDKVDLRIFWCGQRDAEIFELSPGKYHDVRQQS